MAGAASTCKGCQRAARARLHRRFSLSGYDPWLIALLHGGKSPELTARMTRARLGNEARESSRACSSQRPLLTVPRIYPSAPLEALYPPHLYPGKHATDSYLEARYGHAVLKGYYYYYLLPSGDWYLAYTRLARIARRTTLIRCKHREAWQSQHRIGLNDWGSVPHLPGKT